MTDIMLLSDNTLQFSAYRPVRGRDGSAKIAKPRVIEDL